MLDALFIHTIQVVRYIKLGENSMGEASTVPSTPYASLGVRIESWQETTEYRGSGERKVNQTIIYVRPGINILLNDDIYQDGTWLGTVIGINPALKAFSTELDHLEIVLQKP